MNAKSDKTPQKTAKLVQSALELDGQDRNEEAYVKYLESISFIASSLRTSRLQAGPETERERLTKNQAQKLLVVARQCLDRIETLTDELEDDEVVAEPAVIVSTTTDDLPEIGVPPNMLLSRPLSALASPRTFPSLDRTTAPKFVGGAKQNSNSILEAIDWVSPEKMSLEDELNAFKADTISLFEKASRENESLIASYRVRIERTPTASARSNLQLELQRRITENLDIARQKQVSCAAHSKRLRQKHLESAALTLRLRGNEAASKRLLRLLEKTLEYELKQPMFAQLREKLEAIQVGSVDLKTAQTVIRKTLADPNHPLSKEVKASTCRVLERIRLLLDDAVDLKLNNNNNEYEDEKIGSNYEYECGLTELDLKDDRVEWSAAAGVKCAACHGLEPESTIPFDEDPSEEAIDFQEVYRRGVEQVKSALAEGAQTMDSLKRERKKQKIVFARNKSSAKKLSETDDEDTAGARPKAASLKSGFDDSVQAIRDALDDLLDSFVLVYGKALDDDGARDACRVHIESHFYPPIYPSLLNLCRLVCGGQEKRLRQSMERLADCRLADLGYRDAATCSSRAAAGRCEEAAVALGQLVDHDIPGNKLTLLVQVAKAICKCNPTRDEPPARSISADDLIPLLSYACIRSKKPQLVSECFLLDALTHQRNLMGEEGYCLTSLQTSLQYIASLSVGTGKQTSTDDSTICRLESTV